MTREQKLSFSNGYNQTVRMITDYGYEHANEILCYRLRCSGVCQYYTSGVISALYKYSPSDETHTDEEI